MDSGCTQIFDVGRCKKVGRRVGCRLSIQNPGSYIRTNSKIIRIIPARPRLKIRQYQQILKNTYSSLKTTLNTKAYVMIYEEVPTHQKMTKWSPRGHPKECQGTQNGAQRGP